MYNKSRDKRQAAKKNAEFVKKAKEAEARIAKRLGTSSKAKLPYKKTKAIRSMVR